MKTGSKALAVAAIALALFGATSAQAALVSCVSIVGTKQGAFNAQYRIQYCANKIEATAFEYSVISPRDTATGQATGRRMHKPVRIRKEWGAASTQLFQALIQNEVLASVVIDFYANDSAGMTVLDHTIKLTNAFVTSIEHSSESVTSAGPVNNQPATETVEFVFQQIELIDHRSKTAAMDSSRVSN